MTGTPTLEAVFEGARQLASSALRGKYLDETCGRNVELRRRVDRLLAAHSEAGSFLESPAGGVADSADPLDEAPFAAEMRIGPYTLQKKLGEGGMGSVWAAEQHEPVQRPVALKFTKAGVDTAQLLARFAVERQALAVMGHPNIAKVFDAGTTPTGRPFFAMELVQGISITQYCDEQKLSPRERLELFIPVCHAVQHAHQKGIIHRDLKPSNILVGTYDGKPVPKVIDFGVAKAAGPNLPEHNMDTEVGARIGTLEYMAPEQAEPGNQDIDTRADVYSLGVVLYELLAGSPPFSRKQIQGAAFAEILRMIREVEPPKPSTKLSTSDDLRTLAAVRKQEPKRLTNLMRGDLDWIVMKCLEKERGRRYETANGLAVDIQRYLADEPVLAGPPSAGYRVRKFVKRNKGTVVAACLLLLSLVGGITGTSWQWQRAIKERDDKINALQTVDKERQRAQGAEADSKTFSNFLVTRVLSATRPEDLQGGLAYDISLAQALEEAERHIEQDFAGRPLAEAITRHALGVTWRTLSGNGQARAEGHLRRAIELRERELGPNDRYTLQSRNSLGVLLASMGQYSEAIKLLEEVRDQWTKRADPDDDGSLSALGNLAHSYCQMGRYADAIKLHEYVWKRRTEIHGPDHESTLQSCAGLALAYSLAGQVRDALSLSEANRDRAVAALGTDHPVVMSLQFDLAGAYRANGRPNDSVRLLEDLRTQRIAKFGPNHPRTLFTLNFLASVYRTIGKAEEAAALCEDVSDRQSKKLGRDHPETLNTLNNLAGAYLQLGKTPQAIRLFEQVRDTRVKILGPDHPDSLVTLIGLANAYQARGDYTSAIKILEQIRDQNIRVFGQEHNHTLATLNNLARAYQADKRLNDAVPLFEYVRDVRMRTLAPDHPHLLTSLNNLAVAYKAAGKNQQALQVFEQVYDLRVKTLGVDHPNTLTTLNNLASSYRAEGRLNESIKLFEKVRDQRIKKLGPDHAQTLVTLSNLAAAYRAAERMDDAITNCEQAATGMERMAFQSEFAKGIMANTIACYEQAGNYVKAESWRRKYLSVVLVKDGRQSATYSLELRGLGYDLLQQGKHTDAEAILQEWLTLREAQKSEEVSTLIVKSMLGGALLGQKKYSEAEPLLLVGYEGMKKREDKLPASQRTLRLTEALDRLIRLYDETGKPDEAARWRKELENVKTSPKPAAKS